MKWALAAALPGLLVACGDGMTPAEKARADARDVAMVEKAQKQLAPAQPVTLEAIPTAEQAQIPAPGKECKFVLNEDLDGDPVGLFGSVTGHVRIDGKILMLAPDTGTAKVHGAAYGKYVSKSHVVRLEASKQGDGAWLAVVDPHDRAVYFAPGELRCAGVPPASATQASGG